MRTARSSREPRVSLRDWLRALLRDPLALELRGSALLSVAWYFLPKTGLSVDEAIDALIENGLPPSVDRHWLSLRLPAHAANLDRLACDGCAAATVRPAFCDERLHALCEGCPVSPRTAFVSARRSPSPIRVGEA
jgi:hypothetical protein